mgnify:CR=1 FL=1
MTVVSTALLADYAAFRSVSADAESYEDWVRAKVARAEKSPEMSDDEADAFFAKLDEILLERLAAHEN